MNYLVIVPKCGHLVAWGPGQRINGLDRDATISMSRSGNQCGSCNGYATYNRSCRQRVEWKEKK